MQSKTIEGREQNMKSVERAGFQWNNSILNNEIKALWARERAKTKQKWLFGKSISVSLKLIKIPVFLEKKTQKCRTPKVLLIDIGLWLINYFSENYEFFKNIVLSPRYFQLSD